MVTLEKIKARILKKTQAVKSGNGLFVTIDELVAERKNAAYIRGLNTRLTTSRQAGDVKSAFKGRGMEFEEIRAYNFGDDVRDIDWRVTARKLNPYTKLYAEEKDREIYVLLDLSPAMRFGTRKELKSVAAAKIAALLGWLSLENKDRFGCIIFDGRESYIFKPQNHKNSLLAIFKKIAEISQNSLRQQNEETLPAAKAVQLLQKSLKSYATVFVISDFTNMDDAQKRAMAALARRARVYFINVFDVLEEVAPRAGEYMIENRGDDLVFDSRPQAFQEAYRSYFAAQRSEIKDFCHKFLCNYIEVRTDIELYKQLKIG